MTPYEHSLLSVRDFGGNYNDYIIIHKFFDQTKFHFPDSNHRAILHNSFGMQLCEQMFGDYITNSDNKKISVREIARRHILQDCSCVPTLQDCIQSLRTNGYTKHYNKPNKKDLEWLQKD